MGFSFQQSTEEKKAIKETVLAFLEDKRCREAAKPVADGDGASPSPAPESSAARAACANAEDRVDS